MILCVSCLLFIFQSKKEGKIRNQYNQVPHLSRDTTWKSDKHTIRHHKQEPIGQPLPSRGPQGINKQTPRKHNKHKVSKGAKIRNRYNQVPHLTQDTNGKVTNSQTQDRNNTNDAQKNYHLGRCSNKIINKVAKSRNVGTFQKNITAEVK